MRAQLRHLYTKLFEPRAAVLMYHRIAAPSSDIWEIAVSPNNFEQQLDFLKKKYQVISLQEMADSVAAKKIRRNSVALTFDDGYVDNYLQAKPLLEKYELPATFFISSGNIGQETPFWWDELEQLILFTQQLPATFRYGQFQSQADLKDENYLTEDLRLKHTSWRACDEAPPTSRAQLYYSLWQELKPLPHAGQQEKMQQIREWANPSGETLPELKSMSLAQLKDLSSNRLFEIGAHTVSHPALAFHEAPYQKRELAENREFLRQATGQGVNLVAYPYGNYNTDTLATVASLQFKAAFTTEERMIHKQAAPYQLGRFQVKNLPGKEFSQALSRW